MTATTRGRVVFGIQGAVFGAVLSSAGLYVGEHPLKFFGLMFALIFVGMLPTVVDK